MRCEGALALANLGGPPAPFVARHVASCLRCQAEQARRARLRRLLAQLRAEQEALPPGVLASVLEALGTAAAQADGPGTGPGRAWRATAAAGVLGGAVVVLALRARIGLRLPRPGGSASRCYR